MTERAGGLDLRATTILAVRRDGQVALAGDGQVTIGDTVVKNTAHKVRALREGSVLVGFAGAVADAFTLFEKLEEKLERFPKNVTKAVVELAKDWRMDRYLRRLDALLLVADREHLFLVSGQGEVIEPDHECPGHRLGWLVRGGCGSRSACTFRAVGERDRAPGPRDRR